VILALALLEAVAALQLGVPSPIAQDTYLRFVGAQREVGLNELRANAGRYLGQEVRFTLQLRKTVEDWEPFLSRFGPREWIGVEAWPDELFTWEAEVFADPAPRLFALRGGTAARLLARAKPHARFAVRARVCEAFLGEPWIEILELEPQPGEVGPGTILHVERARSLRVEEQWELALEQYARAKLAPLPPHALAAIEAEILDTEEARELDRREQSGPRR